MKINLNQNVKVKLTKAGLFALECNHLRDYKNIYQTEDVPKFTPPEVDNEGYTTFQLWILMNQLGPHIGMGKASIFVDFEIDLI